MATQDVPHILIPILGEQRRYRFDLKAMWDFQKTTGVELDDLNDLEPIINKDIGVMIKLIWSGLYRFDESLTPEDVAGIIDFKELPVIGEMVMDHVNEMLGIEKGKNVKRAATKKKKKSGVGRPPEEQPSA